jgi:hypothetical protein
MAFIEITWSANWESTQRISTPWITCPQVRYCKVAVVAYVCDVHVGAVVVYLLSVCILRTKH